MYVHCLASEGLVVVVVAPGPARERSSGLMVATVGEYSPRSHDRVDIPTHTLLSSNTFAGQCSRHSCHNVPPMRQLDS
jgi:hypothetical protein